MDLTNEDVADVLALLDSLPYDELDLQTARFRLILRRTPDGWTQSAQSLSAPAVLGPAAALEAAVPGPPVAAPGPPVAATGPPAAAPGPPVAAPGPPAGGTGADAGAGLVAVRAPLPGTFYRAPRPGAAPFVEVGSQVGADTVVGIVETMKLMNSVTADVDGTVAEICLGNAEFAAHGATLLRIRAD
jgi:acetyl-CoA carboxylase biotin carboxyl carrier protein